MRKHLISSKQNLQFNEVEGVHVCLKCFNVKLLFCEKHIRPTLLLQADYLNICLNTCLEWIFKNWEVWTAGLITSRWPPSSASLSQGRWYLQRASEEVGRTGRAFRRRHSPPPHDWPSFSAPSPRQPQHAESDEDGQRPSQLHNWPKMAALVRMHVES